MPRCTAPHRAPTCSAGPRAHVYCLQVYCLPDNYEVLDKSLDDIRHVRDPRFRGDEVVLLDK
jgi:hypothetical protein